MAGGSGTRLWPLSRKSNPKQFQSLTHPKKTLIQETYSRIKSLTDDEHIFISTTKEYAELVQEQLPQISPNNIITEPCGRDTAPAMGLVAHVIHKRDPEAVITTTPSDHAIKNPQEYKKTIKTAFEVLKDHPKRFGLIGINPTEPSTELGYIQVGAEMNNAYDNKVFCVEQFKEKPDRETAQKYFAHWSYLWNAAYFVFKASTILELLNTNAPHITKALNKMDTAPKDEQLKIYGKLPKEPIDTVVLEKLSSKERFVVPANLTWSDVGNWKTLQEFYQKDTENISRGDTITIDTNNCLLFGNKSKTVTTLGVKDLIVIDTDDALLVAHKDNVHEIKKMLKQLKKKNKDNLL